MSQKETFVFNKERDVRRFVSNLREYATKALDDALTDVAHAIESQAIANLAMPYVAPGKDSGAKDTGRLMAGFRGIRDERLHKTVGNNVSYAAHMEYGTGPAAGRPKYRPPDGALAGWAGRHGKEELDVGKTIWNRGTYPRRYLGRAFHTKKPLIKTKFFKHFTKKLFAGSGLELPDLK
tara:strand:- start:100 stop:636 length:537 start_codon:yes stop_codon:yes gene_type:complete